MVDDQKKLQEHNKVMDEIQKQFEALFSILIIYKQQKIQSTLLMKQMKKTVSNQANQ
ncbi:unnamed protein product [Paramecium sonneborni]|uniref:Uncharacterized protein n=1 Tax=Paramecium sonneborni TaxID=65129 RepID=A0A8S1P2M8_9CILI|nr:unnamed protein product [Paramecium sonneborni]